MDGGMQIPKLPGYTVYSPGGTGTSHAKKQTLRYNKGYAMESEPGVMVVDKDGGSKLDTAGLPTGHYVTSSVASQGADGPGSPVPKWVEYDRMVLRFFGYFKEAVDESAVENHRVRKVVIQYYVTDGTIQVIEPKMDNSGLPQGTFIKRHRIEKRDGGFVTAEELAVGEEVELYGRVFFIVDCDAFTRNFMMGEYGIELREPQGQPDDPYETFRASQIPRGPPDNDVKSYVEAMLGKATNVLGGDTLKQYLDYSRRVLRFYCVWDDRSHLYGDRRPYVIHYFLEDDTVEVLEVNEPNCGRDPFPQFLKRAPLPRGRQAVPDVTVKPSKDQCYQPPDFRIGGFISVYGRPFLLHDCDEFTRYFYTECMGYSAEEMEPIDVQERLAQPPKQAPHPYNGIGSLEDTLQNCISLLPKPPKRDFAKLMNKDKMILRFKASMVETDTHKLSNADKDRRFVLSYFLADDTISVFEPPVRNSGIIGGKFLERQKVYLPGTHTKYGESDLFVGNHLDIFNRTFELLDADEYSFQYMENNKHVYIRSDISTVLRKVTEQYAGKEEDIRSAVIELDKDGTGLITAEMMMEAFAVCGLSTSKAEMLTIIRHITQKTGTCNFEAFAAELGGSS